jgi:hypothetical protein
MNVLTPNTISDAMIASSIAEPDTGETVWTAYTSTIGDERILTTTHRKYRAAIASTDSPDVGVLASPKTWVDIGPTNRWAMLDNRNSTQSIAAGGVNIEYTPGRVTPAVAGFNITGSSSIDITVTLPSEGVIYTRSVPMVDNSDVYDYFTWSWEPLKTRTEFIVTDLPFYSATTIEVDFAGSDDVGVGSVVFGSVTRLGDINYGTSYKLLAGGVEDDSATMKLIDYKFTIWINQGGFIYRTLERLLGKPAVYFANENVDNGAMVLGFYVDSNISIDTPSFCPVSLSVKGVN